MNNCTGQGLKGLKPLWLLAAIATMSMVAIAYYQLRELSSSVRSLQASVVNQQNSLSDEAMAQKITGLIEAYEKAKRSAAVDAKFAPYQAALEKTTGKHVYGNPLARFTLVEFSDLECPYCKRFHSTPKTIVDASKGTVNWEWKHLPLDFHNPAADQSAMASECVAELGGNRAFWVFIGEVFRIGRGGGQGVDSVVDLAKDIGLDEASFNTCITSGRYSVKVATDKAAAGKLGINGTPATFVVDNTTGQSQLLGGAQPPEAILVAIRKLSEQGNTEHN
ncbi:DsbA family protein [Azomonas macrocytogenes]|uniref:Protein-disulfide isomerase n=1 Tax=Azomonas macrocytogenes TaxID=69962 RepID=A0A839TAT6_AZOMA|nr:DsbA family protein [Azomonas macrocytogenes]MBB3105254.1 protein-disulfide isomerase [Azomonas macrocytogenes]